jgi:hypothetical protein
VVDDASGSHRRLHGEVVRQWVVSRLTGHSLPLPCHATVLATVLPTANRRLRACAVSYVRFIEEPDIEASLRHHGQQYSPQGQQPALESKTELGKTVTHRFWRRFPCGSSQMRSNAEERRLTIDLQREDLDGCVWIGVSLTSSRKSTSQCVLGPCMCTSEGFRWETITEQPDGGSCKVG